MNMSPTPPSWSCRQKAQTLKCSPLLIALLSEYAALVVMSTAQPPFLAMMNLCSELSPSRLHRLMPRRRYTCEPRKRQPEWSPPERGVGSGTIDLAKETVDHVVRRACINVANRPWRLAGVR